ncbi:hypothetical protein T4B_7688 [Trichinella pseudospiralis]|uniref:Uncharacterized protein n=1 Tax=Trichinella pseudospiralis TaxID=6337 RepID=A0A0V1JCB0_TRIPS|nr:hypothetical protein T4B_7688 [Trichinella pseudospiralis]
MFTCNRKKRKLVEEKKLLLVNQRRCSGSCYSGWIVISSRSHVESSMNLHREKNVSRDEKKERILLQTLNFFFRFQCSRCRAHARSFPKLKLDRGGKINFSRFISPNPSAFVCFRGNRLAAHTLAVIERCECACGSAANATTLAKLSLYHWLHRSRWKHNNVTYFAILYNSNDILNAIVGVVVEGPCYLKMLFWGCDARNGEE